MNPTRHRSIHREFLGVQVRRQRSGGTLVVEAVIIIPVIIALFFGGLIYAKAAYRAQVVSSLTSDLGKAVFKQCRSISDAASLVSCLTQQTQEAEAQAPESVAGIQFVARLWRSSGGASCGAAIAASTHTVSPRIPNDLSAAADLDQLCRAETFLIVTEGFYTDKPVVNSAWILKFFPQQVYGISIY